MRDVARRAACGACSALLLTPLEMMQLRLETGTATSVRMVSELRAACLVGSTSITAQTLARDRIPTPWNGIVAGLAIAPIVVMTWHMRCSARIGTRVRTLAYVCFWLTTREALLLGLVSLLQGRLPLPVLWAHALAYPHKIMALRGWIDGIGTTPAGAIFEIVRATLGMSIALWLERRTSSVRRTSSHTMTTMHMSTKP